MTKNSIRKIPILARTLLTVEKNTKDYGIAEALRRLAVEVNTKLSCNMSPKTREVLAKERVVLIGNHPTDTEPFALFASLPPRRDVKLIVSDCMINLSKVIDQHLIPVHVRISEIDSPVTSWRPTALLANGTTEKKEWTSEKAHEFNVRQMQLASQRLSQGDLIMLFPGRRAKDKRWFPGVGYLLHDAKSTKPIYVVNAHVSGTSYWDLLRLLPWAGRFMPRIHVEFSEPIRVNSLQSKPGKEIAHILEDKYEGWLRSFKS